jgi:soluble epoxide hydrolase/lipid-phosphate phosphatase
MSNFLSKNFSSPSTGKPIHYLIAGPSGGPLLIFLHGWPMIAKVWKYQIQCFSSLGFRVAAPDMPGYGQTWTSKNSPDFSMEKIVPQCIEVLNDIGRKEAIWIGHDWGCGPLWGIASHHPEVCRAVIGMSVPYRTLELGVQHLISTVDRDLYPADEYPYGQWDYQIFYEQNEKEADRQFESNISDIVKLFWSKGRAQTGQAPARTSSVTKDKGWFGGIDAELPQIPLEKTSLDQDLFVEIVASLNKTGFRGATSWYLNHAANAKYAETSVNDGVLQMPVLFIHTEYDAVCQTVHNPKLMKEMRSNCPDLSEITIKTGHCGMTEGPEATNAGITEWILQNVKDWWPASESIVKL